MPTLIRLDCLFDWPTPREVPLEEMVTRRRSFKSDISFLEKIAMGAAGTQRVFENLRDQGHNPLELERGSRNFKLWKKIKIKRIRVPDILCVACGHRIESRAKTALEVSMSHSRSDPERGWDYGLNDSDYVSLVVCMRSGDTPVDWQASELVQYASVEQLRSAQKEGLIVLSEPKGAQEGFEARIIWPAVIAHAAGRVTSVAPERLQICRQADNRIISLSLRKQGQLLTRLVEQGEEVVHGQVLAAVVPVLRSFPCSSLVTQEHYLAQLSSMSLSERYAAAKALSLFRSTGVTNALLGKVRGDEEHIYVRIEAAASLARQDEAGGWAFIKQCLADDYLQNRLEAVIVLAEIPAEMSLRLLSDVLADEDQHAEIRAGAAWGLGELGSRSSLAVLVDSFSAMDEGIRVEAARALAKLAAHYSPEIVAMFSSAASDWRPGMAWALSRAAKIGVRDLVGALVDEDARHWVAYILGTQDQQRFIADIEQLKERDPELYFAVTVLWKIMRSWVYDLEEYG